MKEPKRISPQEARSLVLDGSARLVCAYDDPKKCRSMELEGSIPLEELEETLDSTDKNRRMIFYCA